MKLHPSKALLRALDIYELELYSKGYFPEVHYERSEGCTSFHLFERMEVTKLLFKCLDLNMREAGIEYGAFSRKHGDKFIAAVSAKFLSSLPATSERITGKSCVGFPVKLWGIEDKYNFRVGTIAEQIYMDGIIFDVSVTDENGYDAETGSAYIWEIAMIKPSLMTDVWVPFHLSPEEKELQKEMRG